MPCPAPPAPESACARSRPGGPIGARPPAGASLGLHLLFSLVTASGERGGGTGDTRTCVPGWRQDTHIIALWVETPRNWSASWPECVIRVVGTIAVRGTSGGLSTGCLRVVRWPFAELSPVVCWPFAGLFASCGSARRSLLLRGTAAVFTRGPLGPTPWRTHACCGKVIAAVPFVRFCGSPSGGGDLSGGSDPSDSGSPSASRDCRPAGSPARRGRRNSSSWKGIQGGEARRDPCAGSA